MSETRAKRIDALCRRRDHLVERLARWQHGDPSRTRGELSALRWAIRLVEACEEEGVIDELRERGYQV